MLSKHRQNIPVYDKEEPKWSMQGSNSYSRQIM